ncbi:MAG: response regulator [Eubacteriales bacterium]|nr:response regulator [Eubacteriales bacterium]
MYTVMIVEDELLVRMGLMALIPWDELRLRVVAKAINGQEAWAAYQKFHPDIVMTDIRIPGMNGLELMRAIRAQDATCALIVITCVEDFSTLQSAMESGAIAYLVKSTMEQQDVIDAAKKACDFLQKNNRPFHEERNSGEQEQLLRDYAADQTIGFEEMLQRCPPEMRAGFPGLIYMRMTRAGGITPTLRRSIMGILKDRLAKMNPIVLPCGEKNVLMFPGEKIEWDSFKNVLEGIHRYSQDTFGLNVLFAACSEEVRLQDLPGLVKKIADCYPEDYLYDSAMLRMHASGELENEALRACLRLLRENIWQLRDGNSVMEIRDRIDRMEESICNGWTTLCNSVIFLARYISAHSPSVTQAMLEEFCKNIKDETSFSSLFSELLERIVRPAVEGQTMRMEIAASIQYMARNLRQEISLTHLASMVGLNATYFSRLFKQELGMGFSDFMTILRVDQAQVLLKKRNMSIQEISEQCGFSDVSYFCRKFKSVVGMAPSVWRIK